MADATGEGQRILPVLEAEAELAWLHGRLPDLAPRLVEGLSMAGPMRGHRGRLARWLQESGALDAVPPDIVEPYRSELEGRWRDAAAEWRARGMPYEEARALAHAGPEGRRRAADIARRLGAEPLLRRLTDGR